MVLTDQQLRQELINYGEIVPPITQRNREQLRARLEVLRSQKQTRAASSPSRSHATASPSRSHGTSSPSRTRATASPSASRVSGSPSRSRAAASPSRPVTTSSPSRTRGSATTNTGGSGRTTRSKQTPNLIELSDSETESLSAGTLMSHSLRSGQTAPNVQKRSIALRSHDSPTSLSSSSGLGNMTNDVELSIARHRREIKQLLDSTSRDRNRATNTNTSSLHSGQHPEPSGKSSRSNSPSSSSKTRTRQQSSPSDDDTKSKRSSTSDKAEQKKSSSLKRIKKPIQSFWKKYTNCIKNLLKLLLVGSILLGGVLFLVKHSTELLPRQHAISCSVKNATECEDMKPVIAAVRKQLQIRTGEVDCGFRVKNDIVVKREEIEKYLNEKGFKFNLGNDERWKAVVTYILQKNYTDILVWNEANQQTTDVNQARKLSTKEAVRSLTCRARQDINKTMRNLILLVLGSTGLLTLAWYLQRQSKTHEENEKTFKTYLDKAKKLIQEQYEKHIQDPQAQPWLAISHIRDKLIPEGDQERFKNIWERIKNEINKQDSRLRTELQEIDGKTADVWRWIKSAASSPKKIKSVLKNSNEETDDYTPSTVGLTECLKLRNCFRSDNYADDEEIDHVVDSIKNRCANIKRIDHIGIHSVFVYLKFSSKEAAAQGYHLLNNWNYQDRDINVKYIRLNRYYEHFPEAKDDNTNN